MTINCFFLIYKIIVGGKEKWPGHQQEISVFFIILITKIFVLLFF